MLLLLRLRLLLLLQLVLSTTITNTTTTTSTTTTTTTTSTRVNAPKAILETCKSFRSCIRCISGAKVTLGCPWGAISTGGPPHRRVDLSHRKQRFRDKNLL